MNQHQVIQFYKIFFAILLSILILGITKNINAGPNAGSDIVDIAKSYLNYPRADGYPLNKEIELGGIFDEDTVTAFDCTGLVSWAAGLRRHYYLSQGEINQFYTEFNNWDNLQPGDIFDNGQHVMIFENWAANRTKITVVQASESQGKVIESTFTLDYMQSNYTANRFKTDNTNPTITISGVEDGGVYNNPVTVGVSADDDTSEPTPGLYFYGQDSGGKFRQKQFTEEGTYYDYFI